MSICIDKLPHSCGTKKGLQVFANEETGKIDGFCFSCKKYIANPYGKPKTINEVSLPKTKSAEEILEEIAEVSSYIAVDVPTRKLRSDILEEFSVKTSLSEEDGKTPTHMYFPIRKGKHTTGYYVKTLSEPFYTWSIGEVKDGDMFGWKEALESGAYRLIITEGPEDAMAVKKIHQLYGKSEYMPAVVSLTNGVNSLEKNFNRHKDNINNTFKEVVLCFDNDEPGREALQKAMLMLPNAKTVSLPEKDANDCLIKGLGKTAYKRFAFDAHTPKNSRVINAKDLFISAREPAAYGSLTWPYPTMNKLLRNMRTGETIYIGAGVKMGKSELVNDLGAHLIKAHNVPIFMAKPEEANKKTVKMVAGKIVGKLFHDPDRDFDFDAYDKATEIIDDKLMLVNLYQHLGWDSLKQDIVYAANQGAKAVFIDPITNLTNGVDSGEANTLLSEIAQDLSAMALDLDIVAFIFCHLKASEGNISKDRRSLLYKKGKYTGLGNCPHEFGGDVMSYQFAGSRAMMRSCNLMLGLEGNKDPDLPEEIRNRRNLRILEDREFGNASNIPLFWNKNTTLFKEI